MTDAPAATTDETTPDAADAAPDGAPSTRYVPEAVETKWIATWDEQGAFHAEVDESREAYTIVVPPPNVTGALHMGHALNGSVQDTLIRFKRMQGYNALWIPGVDHAGIATQSVVEKELRKEGTTRHDLGREAFVERIQAWKEQYAETIHGQFKRLGASMDFRRARFTMDEHYERAVLHAFVKLYEDGFVYRANRLVNWDAGTMSAISDLEVVQKDVDGEMVHVAYPLVDGGGEIVIATARPETIPADVAIAVHPDDERYREMVGKLVRVPFSGREVPIIADEAVEIEFGTGALKITPGHALADFEIGERHGLDQLSAILPDRTMSDITGEYAGLGADEARVKMTDALEEQGALRLREPYRHSVPHSDRSGVRIEPLISLQWFADMRELAAPVVQWVNDGEVRFVPDGMKSIFHGWMDDLKPWCLSRQLWWGHQLPVWYHVDDETKVHVSISGPPAEEADQWRRDDDVLDTWFSSGMWDHATLGWPDDTPELRHFHPTAVLCTGRDIINLWVARMMMFSNDHVGEIPFRDVYLHSTIQAPDGRRMSKSLGTGIDPLELIAQYGADATRYGLLDMSSTQDVRFNEGRIKEGNQLANKLWNAVRLLNVMGDPTAVNHAGFDPTSVTRLEDRWILVRLDRVLREVTRAFDAYEFALSVKSMYAFVWNELCDWYLESVKGRLRSEDEVERADATRMLAFLIDRTIRMLHPIMPHLTEELAVQVWGEHGLDGRLVARSPWHERALPDEATPPEFAIAEQRFELVQQLVTRLRNLRQASDIKPSVTIDASLRTTDPSGEAWQHATGLLRMLANVDVESSATGTGIALPIPGATLTLFGLDPVVLKPRLEADLKTARGEVKRAQGKLANEKFTARAPQELVQEERDKIDRFNREATQLESVLEQL
ncbi:MAG: valine--tRNA ligase [Thermoleophilia bacterium]|nr:valine--tRNA ligase [Thermoleophilia bacterium]